VEWFKSSTNIIWQIWTIERGFENAYNQENAGIIMKFSQSCQSCRLRKTTCKVQAEEETK